MRWALRTAAAGLFVLGLFFVWWRFFHSPYETILVLENHSGQTVHAIKVSHNNRVVYRVAYSRDGVGVAIMGLDPLKGLDPRNTLGHPNRVDAWFTISFRREAGSEEESHTFDVPQGEYAEKCLLVIAITPRSVERRGGDGGRRCYWMSKSE
jgi:hypothetical protein